MLKMQYACATLITRNMNNKEKSKKENMETNNMLNPCP